VSQYFLTITLIIVTFISLVGVGFIARWIIKNSESSNKNNRIARFVVSQDQAQKQDLTLNKSSSQKYQNIGKLRNWINKALSRISSEKLQIKISSAYWAITDTEYSLIRVFAACAGFLLGWSALNNVLGGVFLGAIAIMLPPIMLDRAIAKRQKKFQDQLLDVLILIKGAVQAGYGLMQSLDLAVQEIPAPASEEFGRILHENRLGITLEGALTNLAERMESDDLQIVVTAIIINAQIGGNLSTLLASAIETIRDRMHLTGEVRSLTSYARYVGNFLTLMPFIAGLIIFLLSPGYFDSVKTSLIAQGFLGAAVIGVIIGNIWISQLVKIQV
jgi:tight adherence protein B